MKRFTTGPESIYVCRYADTCPAEEWIEEVTGVDISDWPMYESVCDHCPFISLINHLSTLEDRLESFEDLFKTE